MTTYVGEIESRQSTAVSEDINQIYAQAYHEDVPPVSTSRPMNFQDPRYTYVPEETIEEMAVSYDALLAAHQADDTEFVDGSSPVIYDGALW